MLFKGVLLLAFAVGSFALPVANDEGRALQGRIVGGNEAPEGSAPWMVALITGFFIKSQYCGGSLVTDRLVLTAGHCIQNAYGGGQLISSLRIVAGSNRWNVGGTEYALTRNITHPNYLHHQLKNDLGFLVTRDLVQLSDKAQPVKMSYDFVGGNVRTRITGWGHVRHNGSTGSRVLLELYVDTISSDVCVSEVIRMGQELNMRPPAVEPHIELCTYHSKGVGLCNGDSGSALVLASSSLQVGVVSWSFPCARGAPDVYARISAYQEFIEDTIANVG